MIWIFFLLPTWMNKRIDRVVWKQGDINAQVSISDKLIRNYFVINRTNIDCFSNFYILITISFKTYCMQVHTSTIWSFLTENKLFLVSVYVSITVCSFVCFLLCFFVILKLKKFKQYNINFSHRTVNDDFFPIIYA